MSATHRRFYMWWSGVWPVAALVCTGCTHSLTIYQDRHVNTAMQRGRAASERTGEPLEVDIVLVHARDLEEAGNAPLKPGSKLATKTWFEKRPMDDQSAGGRFKLPDDQIFYLSDRQGLYGTRVHDALRGAALDGESVHIPTLKSRKRSMWKGGSRLQAVYIFPRFLDANADVIDVAPVVFGVSGGIPRNMKVNIGVTDPEGRAEQYIRIHTDEE